MSATHAAHIADIRGNVPGRLLALPIWLLHDRAKTPIYADGSNRCGALDSPEDRARLVTFERAASALPRIRRAVGPGLALGRVNGERIGGIDFDHCVDSDGVIDPRVLEIMGAANAYAERSPSGRGVHIIGTGDIGTTKTPGLEIYSGARYFTVTGQRLNRADLADLTEAATLARRLYPCSGQRRTYTAPVVPIRPELIEQAGEKWAALLKVLEQMQMLRGTSRTRADGAVWIDITCPWIHEHSDGDSSGTAISEPSAANGWWGGFRCHHAHCELRGMRDVRRWLRELVRIIDDRRAS